MLIKKTEKLLPSNWIQVTTVFKILLSMMYYVLRIFNKNLNIHLDFAGTVLHYIISQHCQIHPPDKSYTNGFFHGYKALLKSTQTSTTKYSVPISGHSDVKNPWLLCSEVPITPKTDIKFLCRSPRIISLYSGIILWKTANRKGTCLPITAFWSTNYVFNLNRDSLVG